MFKNTEAEESDYFIRNMNMNNIKELQDRWLTNEGQNKVQIIIDSLKKNIELSNLKFLETYCGRVDLRGIKLSSIEKEKKIVSNSHTFIQRFGTLKLKNNLLSSIDFSYSDICYSFFERVTFDNCIFEETKAVELRIIASNFNNCIFNKSNLYYSYMNENIGNKSGSFNNCDFTESNLSKCLFYFPIINNCKFRDCNLEEADFDGSRITNTKFVGLLESVWFRGYAKNVISSPFYSIFKKKYKNPMLNVNFEDALLKGVSFSNNIDLSNCIFPINDNYIYIKDIHNTFNQVKNTVKNNWKKEEDIRKAMAFIDTIYLSHEKFDQHNDLIDKFILIDEGKDCEFGEKFFNLIKVYAN